MAEERLQRILARAGFGSRRSAEELITAGRVVVNGKVAELGSKADPQRDHISVDGRRLKLSDELIYIAVYKPPGVLSTTAGPDPRSKVTDLVPGGDQLHLVGRLDLESEGLMLLTNDGELTQQLTHPRYQRDKEYRVLVAKRADQKQLETWRRGVVLPDGVRSEPAEVRIEKQHGKGMWLRVIMHEGRKREIREIARTLGLPVAKLIRVRIATLHVGGLKAGDWRKLSADEVNALRTGVPIARTAAKTFSKPRRPTDKRPLRKGGRPDGGKPKSKRPTGAKPWTGANKTTGTASPRKRNDDREPRSAFGPRKRSDDREQRTTFGPRKRSDEREQRSAFGPRKRSDERPQRGGPPSRRANDRDQSRSPKPRSGKRPSQGRRNVR
jgi:23S rRNA pseudouridine2605 synthase